MFIAICIGLDTRKRCVRDAQARRCFECCVVLIGHGANTAEERLVNSCASVTLGDAKYNPSCASLEGIAPQNVYP